MKIRDFNMLAAGICMGLLVNGLIREDLGSYLIFLLSFSIGFNIFAGLKAKS